MISPIGLHWQRTHRRVVMTRAGKARPRDIGRYHRPAERRRKHPSCRILVRIRHLVSRPLAGPGPEPTRDLGHLSRRRKSRSRQAYARNHHLKQRQSMAFEIQPLWATILALDSSRKRLFQLYAFNDPGPWKIDSGPPLYYLIFFSHHITNGRIYGGFG